MKNQFILQTQLNLKKKCGGKIFMFAFAAHLAMAAKSKAEADVIPSGGNAVVRIPKKAVEVTPGVFSLMKHLSLII